ncbi:hypothetical protein [Streptomyces sp. HUAS ZL42]|uniref:hypothetical protein n=1 Tax=Streptomyces sp. HUAS ZL42 TaxID=3231715 RepID=UPI00345EE18F
MQEPDQEHTGGDAPSEMEVLSGPGGPEREGTPLRGVWQRRSARGRAVIAAATVVALGLGGTVAYAATSGNSGESGAAAAAASSASASPDGPGERHGPGRWFGLGGEGVHGEATVKDRDTGKWVVRIWQRGTVEKVDGDEVTVKSDDGAEWTWKVASDTPVNRDGASDSGADALKKGETAFLVGSRDGDTRTATRVLAGTFEDKGPGKDDGKGDRHGRLPGHGHGRGWGETAPSPSPSGSGATT